MLRLTPQALARSRFALSPLAECLAAAIALTSACHEPWLADWHSSNVRPFRRWLRLDPFAGGLIALVSSTKWLPAPVAIPPTGGMRTTLASELARVRALDDDLIRDELHESRRHSWRRQDLRWAGRRALASRVAEVIETVWAQHVEPDWTRRRSVLERDVMYRAGLLAAYGWPAAIDRMSKHSAWIGADTIRFSSRPTAERTVSGAGMLFVPVSIPRGAWLAEWPPAEYALIYPARGAAASAAAQAPEALDRLVGVGRARILRELERPATTTELATELQLSLGTVGEHLAVLRDSGMVTRNRVGRRVVYLRTEVAEAVVSPH